MAKRVILRENLLSFKITPSGYKQYEVVPSKVTEAEFKRMVKRANDRLYKLEKAGLAEKSREYREVEHYALSDPAGKGDIYNVNPVRTTIRFTTSLRGKSASEKAYLINTVRNFLNAETSTISGTKKAFRKAYESFMKNDKFQHLNMTEDQYEKIWQVYRDMVTKDKAASQGYNAFIEIVKNTNLYELTPEQIEQSLTYISKSNAQSTSGIAADVIESVQMEHSDYNLQRI